MDAENVASASGANRTKFSSEQGRLLLFDSEDEEQDQSMNYPDKSKLGGGGGGGCHTSTMDGE